jgi:hypothetical protein
LNINFKILILIILFLRKIIGLIIPDNDFDDLLPLIDKDVKGGKSEEAIFKLFSSEVKNSKR